ncbi:unnamed protein product [Ceutorhynchus assimilis]|uniref:isoleucine--tRNA ligase n=1 Tax=Ceutorhynchus assimilis TaxID=467358 RepID=A0A9P0DME9_9CUCU|nr:unnamed protein product [Ceutorhynchus assimilis]
MKKVIFIGMLSQFIGVLLQALAEAELEYNENHISPSAYVRLEIKNIPQVLSLKGKKVFAIIWTTTPWTLPSNQAICYNNTLTYCLIKKPDLDDKDVYIVAMDLFDSFCKETNCDYQLLGVHSGEMLKDATYIHPIYKQEICPFLHSSHATSTKGTGLVHTAPAHGPDDFLVGIKNKIIIRDLITDEGLYKPEAGEIFANKFVLTDGNELVMQHLAENLLHKSEIVHSCPYDWRTKKPVIIKASKQWFIDTNRIKNRAIELLECVNFMPEDKGDVYKKALVSQLQKRPYWCISRQRKWGVPIPVFYGRETGEILINRDTIEHFCAQLKESGTDFWWKLPLEHLLPSKYPAKNYLKGEDILDIWFDSGVSWSYALKDPKIADLYLEGVDQFNGWFQSSLITSTALRDKAPYKNIFVHGFAVDEKGVKMSKSLGNVVDPVEVACGKKGGQKAYGVDALRWWVACHANQVSLASVSDNILSQSKDEIQKIRSALRFAIGALTDYEYQESDFQKTQFSDRYILHELYEFYHKAKSHINSYNFHKINTSLIPLLTNQVSAIYFTSIKDRLYCEPANSDSRRSAQFTLLHLYYTVASIVGGILPHLIEETYSYLPQKLGQSFFTSEKLKPQLEWQNFEIQKAMEIVLEVRKEVNKAGGSLNSEVVVGLNGNWKFDHQDLRHLLQVANVELRQTNKFYVEISKSDKFSCPRCRLVQSLVENGLCLRCQRVVEDLGFNKKAIAG